MKPPDDLPPTRGIAPLSPLRCVLGDTLSYVHVLSEAEWQALPEDERPTAAEFIPGLGWVVATASRQRPTAAPDRVPDPPPGR